MVKLDVKDNEATLSCEYAGSEVTKTYTTEIEADDTRNKKVLKAMIAALEHMTKPSHIIITCNSIHVSGALSQHWPEKWRKAEWKRSNGEDIANKDQWIYLMELLGKHQSYEVRGDGNE